MKDSWRSLPSFPRVRTAVPILLKQSLVAKLKAHITVNYYTCTDEILAGLGKMYVADDRFRENIDTYGDGTAAFAAAAIDAYCKGWTQK